jgi:16S rRNA (cytosine1407-C5)-methyltransferase
MLPEEFKRRLGRIFPADIARATERTFSERPTTFRCNTLRAEAKDVLRELQREGFTVRRVNWYGDGFILTNRSQRELTKLPIYKQGMIYLQSLASMVPPVMMAPMPGERVLDMTAAPGSKTSQIAAMMRRQGELVACELDPIRFERLRHNMELLGVSSEDDKFLSLVRGDANQLATLSSDKYFDRILLDAPCSAESRIVMKDRRTYGFWSVSNIKKRATEQSALLRTAWNLLRPGGVIVYSTCTFAPEENEGVISALLKDISGAKIESIPDMPVLRVLPGLTSWEGVTHHPGVKQTVRIVPNDDIEGFYIAKVRKQAP